MLQICALCALRELGVMHRDIKPANVLIGADGRAILSDFGTATRVSPGEYETWRHYSPSGTRPYRAPEMVATLGYGTNADVWSLGLVFLEIFGFSRGPFFKMRDVNDLRLQHATKLPFDPSMFVGLGYGFDDLLVKVGTVVWFYYTHRRL